MPKSTFYNLPETKKLKLLNAIRSEIETNPFEKVSINMVVKKAEIPRGSFYQYFEDRYDMLSVLLVDFKEKMFEKMTESLKNNNGDIFAMFYEILELLTNFAKNSGNYQLCKNIFSDVKVNTLICRNMLNRGENSQNCDNCNRNESIDKLKANVNMSLLDIKTADDFENMIKILMLVLKDATVETFMNVSECDIKKKEFKRKLQLIKHGFEKRSAKDA